MSSTDGVRARNRRRVHGGCVVQGPREQFNDPGATSVSVSRLGGISFAGGRLQGAGHRVVSVYLAVVAAQDVHGDLLCSIDVSRFWLGHVSVLTNQQSGLDQHACSGTDRLRLDCRDLRRYYLFHSFWVSPDGKELADLSGPRQYVLGHSPGILLLKLTHVKTLVNPPSPRLTSTLPWC